MTHHQPSTAKAPTTAKNGVGEGGWTFRADDPAGLEYDVFRLDCAVDALKGADLSTYRAELSRIAANLSDLMEPMQ